MVLLLWTGFWEISVHVMIECTVQCGSSARCFQTSYKFSLMLMYSYRKLPTFKTLRILQPLYSCKQVLFLCSRSVRTPAGSFRFVTRSGLATAATWRKCPTTVTWRWPRWRSTPSSWSRTWTRAPAPASATRCPAGVSTTAPRGSHTVTDLHTWHETQTQFKLDFVACENLKI